MAPSPRPWQLTLARIKGALPFLSEILAQALAQRSLRRLWTVHIRDFAFENMGLEHNPGMDASELMRSWYAAERREFLSWVSRRGPPPLARAARLALAAKGVQEIFAGAYCRTPKKSAIACNVWPTMCHNRLHAQRTACRTAYAQIPSLISEPLRQSGACAASGGKL